MAWSYFLKRNICKLAGQLSSIKLSAFDDLHSLLVLINTNDNEALRRVQWLKSQFPFINFLLVIQFTQEKKPDYMVHNGILKISKHSFNFFGKPASALQNVIKNQHIDLLINADSSNSLYLHSLAALAESKFKIGLPAPNCNALYPLSIYSQEKVSFEDYMGECRNYLNALCGKTQERSL